MAGLHETDVMNLTEEVEVEKARLATEEIWRVVNMVLRYESEWSRGSREDEEKEREKSGGDTEGLKWHNSVVPIGIILHVMDFNFADIVVEERKVQRAQHILKCFPSVRL